MKISSKIIKVLFIFVFILGSLSFFDNTNNNIQFLDTSVNALCVSACTGCPFCCQDDCSGSECQVVNSINPCEKSCRPKTNCGGGVTTCGSCPPPAPPPPPPPGPPAPPPPPPPPPGCTATTPPVATLNLPANGAVNIGKPVTFTWTNGSFGVGCPQSNLNRIYYKVKQGVDCTAGVWSYTTLVAASASRVLNTELNWGSNYCWFVQKYNGSLSSYSAISEFTTSLPPTLVSSGRTSIDVCGNNTSGNSAGTGTSNPVDWSATFQNNEPANTLDMIAIAILPATGTYAFTGDTIDFATARSKTLGAGTTMFLLNNSQTGIARYQYLNYTTGAWTSAGVGSTELTAYAMTLMDLGSASNLTQSGNQTTGAFRLRFNTGFPAGAYNVYTMSMQRTPGSVVPPATTSFPTNDATALYQYVFRKSAPWSVDLVGPSATLSTSGSINVTWGASDVVGLNAVYSYIYSDVAGSQIRDNTTGITITTPGTALTYPADTPNGGIGVGNLGVKNYTDQSGSSASYTFRIYARDAGCNISTTTVTSSTPSPWMLGVGGDISGRGGISKIKVPNIPAFTIPFTTSSGQSYFSQYGAISGTGTNANGTISRFNQVIQNYLDDALTPPGSSTNLWYDYLLDKVTKNGKTTLATLGSRTISTNFATGIGSAANSKAGAIITGDLIINGNTSCNLRAIVFVQGNLTINPDFTIGAAPVAASPALQTYNGCLFVVRGNVTINGGTAKTPVLAPTSTTQAQYDLVNAFIVTDGMFNAPVDNLGAGRKWDGLYINGGVIAQNTMNGGVSSIKRDLNLEGNNIQPAFFINADPRYKLTFGDDLANRNYSIREFGL